MLKLIRFLKGHMAATVSAPVFKLFEALFELIVPLVVAKIIDVGIAGGDTGYIVKMGIVMAALGAAGLCFSATCQYLAARASLGYGTNLRRALYGHINTFSFSELDKFGAPSLVTRLTSDINQTQTAVAMFIRLVMRAPFIVIGSIVMALTISPRLSLIFIAMSVVVSLILYLIMSRSVPFYRTAQKKLDNVSLLTRENLTGARVVRAFSKQEEENADFAEASDSLARTSMRVGRISALLNPMTFAVVNLAIIAVLWFGGKTVEYGGLTQGEIIALVNYLGQILLALVVIANLVVIFTKASACASRINAVFDTKPSIVDTATAPLEADPDAPQISFEGVSFSYESNSGNSLQDLTFSAMPGETVGVIGGTGAGKSTLVNLIPRFYEATEGRVAVAGHDVRAYPLDQLRKKVGLVPQQTSLFYGTLRDNILWGKEDATDDEIYAALTAAQADDVLARLGGLEGMIMAGGKNLSGGQRQRLTIARALVRRPEILILDDSSSALDYVTDARLRAALKTFTDRMTVVIVSQRATSLKSADKIIVLDDGRPAGIGRHDELLQSCPLYREICLSQLNKEEAAV